MASNLNRSPERDSFLCKKSVIDSISSVSRTDRRESVKIRLNNLPKIKARLGFDQQMAALFALELEKEIQHQNRRMLKNSLKSDLF